MLAGLKVARGLLFKFSHSFPSYRRIRQRPVFNRVFQTKGLVNKWFIVYAHENECGFSRLGMTISKKSVSTASSRNFIKRLIRESFRQNFPVKQAIDIVVCARRRLSPECAAEGRLALIQLLRAIMV